MLCFIFGAFVKNKKDNLIATFPFWGATIYPRHTTTPKNKTEKKDCVDEHANKLLTNKSKISFNATIMPTANTIEINIFNIIPPKHKKTNRGFLIVRTNEVPNVLKGPTKDMKIGTKRYNAPVIKTTSPTIKATMIVISCCFSKVPNQLIYTDIYIVIS